MHQVLPPTAHEIVESLLAFAPLLIYRATVDDLTPTYVSPNIDRFLGYAPDEIVGVSGLMERLLHPDDQDRVREAIREAQNNGPQGREDEFRLRHKEGEYRWFRIMNRLELAEGRPPAVIGLMLDITEQKQSEDALRRSEELFRQAQKMEAVGRLAGGMAHDFNNLLTVVSGYAQLLHRRVAGDELALHYVDGIAGAARQAATLTDYLLTFSRRQVFQPRVVDVNEVIREVESVLRRLAGDDIELVTSLDARQCAVRADPSHLEQVVLNLVVNARDAMPRGGRLTIATRELALEEPAIYDQADLPPGRYILLSVADDGLGMDAEIRSRIFEPFFTTKPEGKGTGLGLSMVYGTVKQSGGDIVVRSEPGRGAVFEILLPRVDAEPEAGGRADGPAAPRQGSETVLVVEDRDEVRALIREVLQLEGYPVLDAATAEAALGLIESHAGPIDLLVTDLVLPHAGGTELASRLREARPAARVLFISGYSREDAAHQGIGIAADLLQKPFTPQMLARRVRETLDSPVRGDGA